MVVDTVEGPVAGVAREQRKAGTALSQPSRAVLIVPDWYNVVVLGDEDFGRGAAAGTPPKGLSYICVRRSVLGPNVSVVVPW